MNLIIDETGEKGILYLNESLTIERIGEIKKLLVDSLERVNSLVIEHSESQEFDLTYLQILYSCYKTSLKKQKQISITRSQCFQSLLESLGLPEPEFYSGQEKK